MYENKEKYVVAMEKSPAGDGVAAVMTQIKALMLLILARNSENVNAILRISELTLQRRMD